MFKKFCKFRFLFSILGFSRNFHFLQFSGIRSDTKKFTTLLQWITEDAVCIDPGANTIAGISLPYHHVAFNDFNFMSMTSPVHQTLECLDDQDSGLGDLDQDWVLFCNTFVFKYRDDVLIVTLAVSKKYLIFVNFHVFFD